MLLEARHMLEDQVDSLNGRLQKNASTEMELAQAQRLIFDLQQVSGNEYSICLGALYCSRRPRLLDGVNFGSLRAA